MNANFFTSALAILISSIPAFAQNQLEVKTTPATPAATVSLAAETQQPSLNYSCYTHPDVKMNKPGRCSQCNVKLKRQSLNVTGKKSATPSDSGYVNDATFFRNCITLSFTSSPTFVP
ncbi:MAG: hypothetical protein AB7G44_04275 [Bacteroidia bacterium]